MFIQAKDKSGKRILINTDHVTRFEEDGKSILAYSSDNLYCEIDNNYIWMMNQLAAGALVFKVDKGDGTANQTLNKFK